MQQLTVPVRRPPGALPPLHLDEAQRLCDAYFQASGSVLTPADSGRLHQYADADVQENLQRAATPAGRDRTASAPNCVT